MTLVKMKHVDFHRWFKTDQKYYIAHTEYHMCIDATYENVIINWTLNNISNVYNIQYFPSQWHWIELLIKFKSIVKIRSIVKIIPIVL